MSYRIVEHRSKLIRTDTWVPHYPEQVSYWLETKSEIDGSVSQRPATDVEIVLHQAYEKARAAVAPFSDYINVTVRGLPGTPEDALVKAFGNCVTNEQWAEAERERWKAMDLDARLIDLVRWIKSGTPEEARARIHQLTAPRSTVEDQVDAVPLSAETPATP